MSCSQYEDPVYIDGVPCRSLRSIEEAIRANPFYIESNPFYNDDGAPRQRAYNYGNPKAEDDDGENFDRKWRKVWDPKDALKESDESAPPEDGPSITRLADKVEDLAERVEKLTKLLYDLSARIDRCRRIEDSLALRLYFLEPNRPDGSHEDSCRKAENRRVDAEGEADA